MQISERAGGPINFYQYEFPHVVELSYEKMKNVSYEYDRLNG